MSVLFLSLYLSTLLSFSFVSHPVVYCILLLSGAFSITASMYLLVGVSWYLALFCLVYVGGVYVLFIFVSVHVSNPMSISGWSAVSFVAFFLGVLLLLGGNPCSEDGFVEKSHYLCSYFEGFSYCLFCLVLMLGFVVVSVVSGEKDSFFR